MLGFSRKIFVYILIGIFILIMDIQSTQNATAQEPCGIESPSCSYTAYGPYGDGNCIGVVIDYTCGPVTWCGVPVPGTGGSGTCAASTCGSGGEIVVTCFQ